MQSDFSDAHLRHWQDAEHLYQAERWANADHLFGLAAECGLKSLMSVFGMPFDRVRDRPEQSHDRKHVDAIWLRYETYRSGYHQGTAYTLPAGTPFQDWDIAQRYANQSAFESDRVSKHRNASDAVRRLINQAKRDGLL